MNVIILVEKVIKGGREGAKSKSEAAGTWGPFRSLSGKLDNYLFVYELVVYKIR